MNDYDFGCLNPHEFETLCTDLLSAHIGMRFERYKPGKDLGIDGKCFADTNSEYILQCKHWRATPTENLIRHLRNEEASKVRKLAPQRYFLATSKALSYTDKNRISKAFDPGILAAQDVYGREDLNDILFQHPSIERRHYKLWIQTTTVLESLLNNDVLGRSESIIEEIKRQATVYVVTEHHQKAQEKLQDKGTIIITGAPGIGKTTLAQQLMINFVSEGFQLIGIAESISEAERVYNPAENQIFYFDDFLGRNYLEALTGHEGNHIVQFMNRIQGNPSKRFVLTSRTTILNQAKILIDNLSREGTESAEYEIHIDSLSKVEKAHILYNHIWHSDLSSDHIQQLYIDQRYKEVVSSDQFNPRLIRYITDADVKSDVPAEGYWEHVKNLLRDPAQIWEHPFDAQIDDYARALVLLVVANSGPIREDDLSEAYFRFLSSPGYASLKGVSDFQICLRHLCGSLLSRTIKRLGEFTPIIDVFNPSIADFVLSRFSRNIPVLRRALISLRSAGCTKSVRGLAAENLISQKQAEDLFVAMLNNSHKEEFVGFSPSFIAECTSGVLRLSVDPNHHKKLIQKSVLFLLQSDPPTNLASAAICISWMTEHSRIDTILLKDWAISAYGNAPDASDIEELSMLCETTGTSDDTDILEAKARAAVEYFRDSVSIEFEVSDIFNDVEITNLDQARINLEDLVISALDGLGIEPEQSCVDEIVDAYDFEEAAHDLISDYSTRCEVSHQTPTFPSNEIDEIFGPSDPRFPDR